MGTTPVIFVELFHPFTVLLVGLVLTVSLAITNSLLGKAFATGPAGKFAFEVAMTMFHLVASILAISDSITDLVLLDAPSVLAHELVKPAVDVAALLVLALRTIVAFVASSFRRDALPVVALETLGPAGEPPVRTFLRLIRAVPAVDLFVAELRSVDTTTRPVATELIGSTSRTTLLVTQVATLDSAITSLASRKTKPCGGAVEPGARAVQLVRAVRALRLPVALDRPLHAGAVRALVAALGRH